MSLSRVQPRVLVLLSTYNGERYLEEQLESLFNQKEVEVQVMVRDDGSIDKTIEILNKYKNKKLLQWYQGKNLGPARSFLDLISKAKEVDYYAFCDQDDVWDDYKLKIAIDEIKKVGDNIPKLYCANYQLVDSNLNKLPDQFHASTTKFSEALVSSCCTGCTVVFNKKLLNILKMYMPKIVVMHDDWTHKVCLAVGGKVIYDNNKVLMYRQHGSNADGGVRSLKSKILGVFKRIKAGDCIRSRQIAEILNGYSEIMPNANIELVMSIADYKKSLKNRLKILISRKIKTPYKELNFGFYCAIFFGYY